MSFGASTYAALGAISTGIGAYGQYKAGKQAKSAYEYNAQIADQEANMTRTRAALEATQAEAAMQATIGEQRAAYAKAGVTMRGSPLEVMVDSMQNAIFDINVEQYNYETAARSLESEATLRRYYGKQVAKEATMRAGVTLLQTGLELGYKFSTKKEKIGD